MKVVGLTGGICSGKTTVCEFIKEKEGCRVVNADLLGHQTYLPGTETYHKILEAFKHETEEESLVNSTDNTINRKVLGGIVFSSPEKMNRLTDIVWPAIKELAVKEMGKAKEEGIVLFVLEAAILLEAGWEDAVDEVWLLCCEEEVALHRLMARNGLSEEEALKRIRSQMSNEEKKARAHVVIDGGQPVEQVKASVASELSRICGSSS
ncbi:DephosphoCoA kinase [Balamuthia mandrillaris]